LLGFSIQAKAKDITVEKLYNTNHPLLMASDSFAISRVLDNLLSNALKFSESNSTIQVQILSISENSTQITIKDEGPGIGAEEITQLFVPFSKGKAQPTAGEKSTGLGLSIVYHLVKLLMGTIEVDSKLGAGATFIITIPNRIEA
jgi:signal transduction histidine kinase